jgi:hypothetical protein
MFFVYGAGAEVGRWGFLVLATGILAYVFLRSNKAAIS